MNGEGKDGPVFGEPPAKRGGRELRRISEGQLPVLPESKLPPREPSAPTIEEARRKLLIAARKQEKAKTNWEELVVPADPEGDIRMQGRYYQLREGVEPLGLFSVPPGVGNASRFYELRSGDWIFVRKGSWESDNSRRNGWGEVYVLAEDHKPGHNPRTRLFDDHGFRRYSGYAKFQGIVDRQTIS